MLGRLCAQLPRLRIESCAGGGGRTDLGMLARTDQVRASDNTDAVQRPAIQHGFSQVHPACVMSAGVTDSPDPLTGRTVPLSDLDRWTPAELAEAARLIEVYKDIRPLVRHGHQYRLLAPGDGALTAVQYVDPDGRPDGGAGVAAQRLFRSRAPAAPAVGPGPRRPLPGRGHRRGMAGSDPRGLRPSA